MTRLIDADALLPMMKYATTDSEIGVFPIKIGFNAIAKVIEDAPTVDAVPVRHGKWIHEVRYTIDSLHSYQQYRCSECGMTYITNTKHCPNCGCRMDEK